MKGREPSVLAEELGLSTSTMHVQMNRGLRLPRRVLPAGLAPGAAGASGSVPEFVPARRAVPHEARPRAGLLAAGPLGVGPLVAALTVALLVIVVGAWFLSGSR